jgi:hypothetical protein
MFSWRVRALLVILAQIASLTHFGPERNPAADGSDSIHAPGQQELYRHPAGSLPANSRDCPGKTRAKGSSITGRYVGKAQDKSMGTIDLSLQITEQDGQVSGVVSSELGVSRISSGEFKAGLLTLTFDVGGTPVTLTARCVGNKLVGSYTATGDSGTFSLVQISHDPVFDPNTIKTLSSALWRPAAGHPDVPFIGTAYFEVPTQG